MEPSETKSGNSIEIITGTEIGYIGTQKIYQKYNKLELEQLKIVGLAIENLENKRK